MHTKAAAEILGVDLAIAFDRIRLDPNGEFAMSMAQALLAHPDGGEDLVLGVIHELAPLLGYVPKSDAEILAFLRGEAEPQDLEYGDLVAMRLRVEAVRKRADVNEDFRAALEAMYVATSAVMRII